MAEDCGGEVWAGGGGGALARVEAEVVESTEGGEGNGMGAFGVGDEVAEGGDDEVPVEGGESGIGCGEVG